MERIMSGRFLKWKGTEHDYALNPTDAERYLRLTKRYMERTQSMTATSPGILNFTVSTPKFNNAQCKYLADRLKVVIESGEYFLKLLNSGDLQFPSPGDRANCLEVFKLLCSLANAVENFIESCCKDSWIQAALFWTNASEYVSSLSFNLQLCKLVFLVSKELRAGQTLIQTEVDAISKAEERNVRVMASQDRTKLMAKVSEYLGKEKRTKSPVYHLADLLLKTRLQRSVPYSPGDTPGSSTLSELYETLGGGLKQSKHKLGEGAFGAVYKAMWQGVEVAQKTFPQPHIPSFEEEVSILARLSHPNIASLVCYSKDKKECSIVMELMEEDLSSLMQKRLAKRYVCPFDLFEAVDIMLQIGEGIRYLHEMKIVHRDLKSKNILVRCLKVKDTEIEYVFVKVADFGLSKIKENTETYSEQTLKQGTSRWMAPEMIKALEDDKSLVKLKYPLKVDVYSFAMVCTEILTGKLPYSNHGVREVYRRVFAGVRPQLPEYCHPKLKDLIERCWNLDASKRPGFDEICAELRHLKCLLLLSCNIIVRFPDKEPADQSPRSTEKYAGCSSYATADPVQASGDVKVSNTSNPRPRIDWVIGLDFGTTYSGFAFALSRKVLDEPDTIVNYVDWPCVTPEKPYCKTLTALYYKRAGPDQLECPSWGHLARSEYTNHRSSQHGGQGQYFTKFKLLLNKQYPETLANLSISSPHTATTIITDYLRQIGEFALAFVEKYAKDSRYEFLKDSTFSRDSVQWCLTVPSIWDDNAKQHMKSCMVNAGLVSFEADSRLDEAVKVVLDPEAASFHCHQKLLGKHTNVALKAKDKILVADVGGGTVDIVVQELIASGLQYRVMELTESSGGLCGGTFVDDSFMRFLSKKIGCLDEFLEKDDPAYKARLLKDWEEIKCAFGQEMMSRTDAMCINLHPKLASKWDTYEMKRGNSLQVDSSVVKLTEQDLKSIFDPVVDEILVLIAAQVQQVSGIKVMFVVGGFASSPYLMQRIRARFKDDVQHIMSPPNPGSAIMEGAVSLALHSDAIVSRIAKKTYGTNVTLSFDENLDPPELLKVTNGKKYCKNRFDVFVRKGSQVEVNKDVTKEYRPYSDSQSGIRFDLYSSIEVNPRYTTVGDTVTKEGEFVVTLPPNYRRRDMIFKFTMYFGRSSIELRAEAQFKDGRGQLAEILELPVEYLQ